MTSMLKKRLPDIIFWTLLLAAWLGIGWAFYNYVLLPGGDIIAFEYQGRNVEILAPLFFGATLVLPIFWIIQRFTLSDLPMWQRWVNVALRALADPWVCQVERVRQSTHLLRRHIKSGDGASALAAIEVLCLLDDADAVLLASRDPEQTEQGHLLLLKHAGHLLPDEVLASVLRDAIEDPWRYGGAVIACLDRMHARGRFLSPDKAADLLDLYDRVHGFSARQAGRHLYVIRDEVFHLFEQLPARDPRWPRFLSLLPYLTKSHRDALLERLLLASSKLTTTALFIDVCESIAATADHETSLEPLLLDHLAVHPESVLRALEVCGSQRTADVLGALKSSREPTSIPRRGE